MQSRGVTVAGVRLAPFALAHAYVLAGWESPVMLGGKVTLADFGCALWTCSRSCWPFPSVVRAVNAGRPDRMLARLGRRYDLRNLDRDAAALSDYVRWHCQLPARFLKERSGDHGSSAPWPMVVAVQLIPMLGEARTWTMPLPLAMAYKIGLDNAQGDTSWKSEAEEAQGYADGSSAQSDS
jgi:hypothetical protein